jgi:hypothetical protein
VEAVYPCDTKLAKMAMMARCWGSSSEIATENDQETSGSLNLLAVTSCRCVLLGSIGEEGLEPITALDFIF